MLLTVSLNFSCSVRMGIFSDTTLSMRSSPTACRFQNVSHPQSLVELNTASKSLQLRLAGRFCTCLFRYGHQENGVTSLPILQPLLKVSWQGSKKSLFQRDSKTKNRI